MKKSLIAVVTLPLLLSGVAYADRWDRDRGDRHHFRPYLGHHDFRHFRGPRHYRRPHHRHYRGPYYGDAGTALAAGLLIGGLVGYSLNDDTYATTTYAYPYPYTSTTTTVYRTVPEPAPSAVVVQQPVSVPECQMTREYTAAITVDGKPKQAYGTKCMKSDGSWVYGAMTIEPDFK